MPGEANLINADSERLFLLEFLVDNVTICYKSLNLDKEIIDNLGSICVSFQFLHYPLLEVCEEDFIQKPPPTAATNNINFQSGKSCLFSLRGEQLTTFPAAFDVHIRVHSRLAPGMLPEKVLIGKAIANLGSSFTKLVTTVPGPCVPTPVSKTLKDTFKLKSKDGNEVGFITIFVRLSCFGKLIVTQFQLSGEDKSFLFKGMDNQDLYKPRDDITPMVSKQASKIKDPCPPVKKPCPCPPGSNKGIGSKVTSKVSRSKEALEEQLLKSHTYDEAFGFRESKANIRPCNELALVPSSTQPADGSEPEDLTGNYKSIGAEINGHALTIRVQKKKKKTDICGQPPCPFAPKLCDCDFPLPPCLVPKCPFTTGPPCPCPCPCPCPLPPPSVCCTNPDCPLGLNDTENQDIGLAPGAVGLRGNQVIFQMPKRTPGEQLTEKEKKFAASVFYKMGTSEDGSPKNVVQVLPQEPTNDTTVGLGTISGLPLDDKLDVFVLKIGNKNEGAEAKSKLELELRTPKMKEPKPIMEAKDTQYLASDCPKKKNSKSKKGGKGGKGGKKGKGKK